MMSAYLHSVAEVLEELHERGFFADCSALVTDSRQLKGLQDVFVALQGEHFDPRNMADDLIRESRCGLVLVEYDEKRAYQSASVIPVLNLRDLLAQFACSYYGNPSAKMKVVAVTGTNGKTTVTRWLAQVVNLMGVKAGVLGTLGYGEPDKLHAHSALTTPDVVAVQRVLHDMQAAGYFWVFLEASSIGLEQRRLDYVQFVCAAFTQLSQDHLDYHGDMESYAKAKLLLAAWPKLPLVVGSVDEPFGVEFIQTAAQAGAKVVTVGRAAGSHIQLRDVQWKFDGIALSLTHRNQHYDLNVPVIGGFNAENVALVFAVLGALGFDEGIVADRLRQVSSAPGRMERISETPCVVVDYAHTPDALKKVLATLRDLATSRHGALTVLFGCGGNRDRAKRPLMGAIAAQLADCVVITSDNPRDEGPQTIIDEVFAGIPENLRSKVHTNLDRAKAISACLELAQPCDVVLLAGKGHEGFQLIGNLVIPHSDVAFAKQLLSQRSMA